MGHTLAMTAADTGKMTLKIELLLEDCLDRSTWLKSISYLKLYFIHFNVMLKIMLHYVVYTHSLRNELDF